MASKHRSKMSSTSKVNDLHSENTFFQVAPGLFCILDANGCIQNVNPGFVDMSGLERQALNEHRLADFLYTEDQALFSQCLKSEDDQRSCEVRWLHPEKPLLWLKLQMSRQGSSHFLLAYDTTDQHNQMAESGGAATLLKTIIRYLPDLIYIKDTNHRFLFGNASLAQQLGAQSMDEVIGKTDADFSPPELTAQYMMDEDWVMSTGVPLINHEELIYHRGGGEYRWVMTTKVPYYDSHGKIAGIIGLNRDITDRKREVQTLAEQKRLLEQITSATPNRIYVLNTIDRAYTFLNRTIFEILGYAPEQVAALGPNPVQSIFNEFDPNTTENWIQRLGQAADGEIVESEVKVRDAKGKVHWLHSRDLVFSRNPDGTLREILGVSQDITESRVANEQLHEQKRLIEQLMQAVPDYMNLYDFDEGKPLYQNRDLFEMLGYTAEQVAAFPAGISPYKHLFDTVDPSANENWLQQIEKASVHDVIEAEIPYRVGDGSVRWALTRNIIFAVHEDGTPRQVVGLVQDITERKQALLDLQEQKHVVERIMKTSANFIALFDLDEGRYMFQNRSLFEMLGYTPEQADALGSYPVRALFNSIDPAESALFYERVMKAADHEVVESEICVRAGDGSLRWLLTRDTIFARHPDGRPRQTVGTTQDITERHLAEAAVREQKPLIEQITTATPDFIGVYDLAEQRHVYTSRSLGEMLHYSPEAWQALGPDPAYIVFSEGESEEPETWMERIHRVKDGEIVESNTRLLGGDGTWYWFHTRDVVFKRLPDGRPRQVVRVAQDITERKKVEEALREQQNFVERVIRTSANVLTVFDLVENRYVFRSHDLFEMLGYTPEQVAALGPNPTEALFNFTNMPGNSQWRKHIEQAADHEVVELESCVLAADGSLRWLATRDTILNRTPDGKPRQIVGVLQDITARRNAEEELRERERFIERITAATPDYLYVYDLDHAGKNYQNRSLLDMLGYSEKQIEELGDRPLVSLFYRDDPETMNQWIENFRNCPDGVVLETIFHVRGGDGEWHWLQMRETVFGRREDGTPYQSVGVGQDITERKRVENELHEQKRFVEKIASAVPDHIYVYDVDLGRNVYMNRDLMEILDYTPEQISRMGANPLTTLFEQGLPGAYDQWMRRLSDASEGEWVESTYELIDGQGRTRWLHNRDIVFTRHEDGSPHTILGSSQDITARKLGEQHALKLAIEQQRLSVLQQFISAASHDLRTPLAVMKANFYLARRHTDPARRLEYIDDIETQTNRLHELIEDMLTLTRLDMTSLTRERLDICQTLQELVSEHQALASQHHHTLTLDCMSGRVMVQASPPEIRRAIVNLIVNAINYTPDDGCVTVRCMTQDHQVIIEVEDTGVGISEADQDRVFDSFYRVDAARSTNTGGTGLGLTITKRIIEAHEGTIGLKSTLGVGSQFRITLPLLTIEGE